MIGASQPVSEIPIDGIVIASHRELGDLSGLIQSIETVGLLHPIVLTPDHRLVTGYHRIEAFKVMGKTTIPFVVKDFDALHFEYASIAENLLRNEGTVLERSKWTARLKKLYELLHPETKQHVAGGKARQGTATDKLSFAKATSKETKKSERTIRRHNRIGEAVEEAGIEDALRGTDIEDNENELLNLSRLPVELRKKVASLVNGGQARSVTNALKVIRLEELKGQVERYTQVRDASVFQMDFRQALDAIQPNCINLLFTDPPYGRDSLPLWSALADFASVVLKQGGCLVSYAPHEYLPEVLASLSTKLTYYWIAAVKQTGGEARFQMKSIMIGWKPLLVFFNGIPPLEHDWFSDVLTGEMGRKDLHEWAQGESEAAYIIEKFTKPGDVVLDPMCGSGTTLLAAVKLGRKAIGIDIDPVACDTTKKELSKVDLSAPYPSLPLASCDNPVI